MGAAGTMLLTLLAIICTWGYIGISRASMHEIDRNLSKPLRNALFFLAVSASAAAIGSWFWPLQKLSHEDFVWIPQNIAFLFLGAGILLRRQSLWSQILAFTGLPVGSFLGAVLGSRPNTDGQDGLVAAFFTFNPYGYPVLLLFMILAIADALLRRPSLSGAK
ncbi:MAG: hypothetical protein JNM27_18725 [Leptospirales bacterium]|nr:hypothetical protein [Leptospirales bacterium]